MLAEIRQKHSNGVITQCGNCDLSCRIINVGVAFPFGMEFHVRLPLIGHPLQLQDTNVHCSCVVFGLGLAPHAFRQSDISHTFAVQVFFQGVWALGFLSVADARVRGKCLLVSWLRSRIRKPQLHSYV